MIKIYKSGCLITIKGHANYDEIGKDIVCSAVSTLALSSIELLKKFNLLKESNYKDDMLNISYIKHPTSKVIIENMLELLNELHLQYPNNIEKIEYRS